jgi:serine/threonine-protein phosphatase 2B catalytic subunit
MNGYKLH